MAPQGREVLRLKCVSDRTLEQTDLMDSSITIHLAEIGISAERERICEAEVSDENLLAEVCLGSREALNILFRRHARLVRRIALRVLRDASEADDLVQDVFLPFTVSAELSTDPRGLASTGFFK